MVDVENGKVKIDYLKEYWTNQTQAMCIREFVYKARFMRRTQ